jgi:DNA-binding MarR family transcriptional regulator
MVQISDVEAAATLRVAVARLYRHLRVRAAWDVTPSQGSVLARIEQGQGLRLGVVADLEGMSAATTSKVVDSLVDRGLVERFTDPEDRRASVLHISPEGDALLDELRTRGTQLVREALNELSAPERSRLLAALPALEHLGDVLSESSRRDDTTITTTPSH